MRKYKILTTIFLTAIISLCFQCEVTALESSEGDYFVPQSVKLSEVSSDSFEFVVTEKQVVVRMEKSMLPTGVEAVSFSSTQLEKTDTIFEKVEKALKDITVGELQLFDFSLIDLDKNESITELSGKLSVTVSCKKGINSVIYFNEETGEFENMEGELSEDLKYITFETDHFSYYILAEIKPEARLETVAGIASNEQTNKKSEEELKPKSESEYAQERSEIIKKQLNSQATEETTLFVCVAIVVLASEFLFTLKRLLYK